MPCTFSDEPIVNAQNEEEEEHDLTDHYFRNRISKAIESLSDQILLNNDHINALQLFYRIKYITLLMIQRSIHYSIKKILHRFNHF